jgi:Raf kinase inhibitor-like YbhB/YbcL family protein
MRENITRFTVAAAIGVLGLVSTGCGDDDSDSGSADKLADNEVDHDLKITSTAFGEGEAIASQYTCDGANTQPQLAWEGVPDGAKELAVVVDDPDAGGGTFVHWVLFGLDPSVTSLPEGGPLPDGARQAKNGAGNPEWMGPCPPPADDAHHYRFTVYALSEKLDADDGTDAAGVLNDITDTALARGTLTATFDH